MPLWGSFSPHPNTNWGVGHYNQPQGQMPDQMKIFPARQCDDEIWEYADDTFDKMMRNKRTRDNCEDEYEPNDFDKERKARIRIKRLANVEHGGLEERLA